MNNDAAKFSVNSPVQSFTIANTSAWLIFAIVFNQDVNLFGTSNVRSIHIRVTVTNIILILYNSHDVEIKVVWQK